MFRIVIAEDDQLFLSGILKHVPWKELDLEVVGVTNCGEDAIALCLSLKPDLFLSDLRMAGINGLEAAAQIQSVLPDCHILFMSAYAQAVDYRAAIKLHAVDFLEKPLTIEEISEALSCATNALHSKFANEKPVSRAISDIMRYMQLHYAENLSIEQLAGIAYFTPNYLSSLFKRETGQTIGQYLSRLRIQAACHLLRQSHESVQIIGEKVGYRDVRHFSKVFCREMGVTPSEYRRFH